MRLGSGANTGPGSISGHSDDDPREKKKTEHGCEAKTYKGRMVSQENIVRSASGSMVYGASDDLYGKPVDLSLARTAITVAMLNN